MKKLTQLINENQYDLDIIESIDSYELSINESEEQINEWSLKGLWNDIKGAFKSTKDKPWKEKYSAFKDNYKELNKGKDIFNMAITMLKALKMDDITKPEKWKLDPEKEDKRDHNNMDGVFADLLAAKEQLQNAEGGKLYIGHIDSILSVFKDKFPNTYKRVAGETDKKLLPPEKPEVKPEEVVKVTTAEKPAEEVKTEKEDKNDESNDAKKMEQPAENAAEVIQDNKVLLAALAKNAGLSGDDMQAAIAYIGEKNEIWQKNDAVGGKYEDQILGACIILCGAMIVKNSKVFDKIIVPLLQAEGSDKSMKSSQIKKTIEKAKKELEDSKSEEDKKD